MAPKRQRGQTSRATYDVHRFVSEEAEKKYYEVIEGKTIIPERGLLPNNNDGRLCHMITEKHWNNFTEQPEPACIAIVKEFYANARENVNVVRIRGVDVHFGAEQINDFYHIPHIEEMDQYTSYKTEHLNLTDVLRGLCQPDAEWTLKDGAPRLFSHRFLSRIGKAWYYFICAKLLPTTHVSDVIISRAVLLYCLVNRMSINVGRVILGSIKHTIHGGTPGGLPHPSLICGLCQFAGVEWSADEPLQRPKIPIESRLIRSYNQWDGAPANPTGAGFIFEAQSPDTEELFADDQQQEDDAANQPSLASLATEVQRLRRDSRRQSRQISYVAQQVNTMMQFNANFTATLAEMFERTGLNSGPNPLQFPSPPVIPDYPQDSPDEDANA